MGKTVFDTIPQEFKVKVAGGGLAVTYDGLRAFLHDDIQELSAVVVQYPNESNNWTAIAQATLILKDGRIFREGGDANPQNVSKNIAPHAIRMALTRSKARAMRDAVNLKGAAYEEFGPDVEDDQEPSVKQHPPQPPEPMANSAMIIRLNELINLVKTKTGEVLVLKESYTRVEATEFGGRMVSILKKAGFDKNGDPL